MPPPFNRRHGKPARPAPAPPQSAETRLRAWGTRIFDGERRAIRPRVAVARHDRIEEHLAEPLVGGLGTAGLLQAAAILARSAGPDEPVAIAAPTFLSGNLAFVTHDRRSGMAKGWTMCLFARSHEGIVVASLMHGEALDKRSVQTAVFNMTPELLAIFGDWTAEDMYVDPELDDRLALRGFPGARRRVAATTAITATRAVSEIFAARNEGPVRATAGADARSAPAPQPLPEAPLYWEAARRAEHELRDGGPQELSRVPIMLTPGAPPIGLESRDLDDLLRTGWRNEAQAVTIASRIQDEPDPHDALARMLSSSLPERAKWLTCAFAAYRGVTREGERAFANEAADELIARFDALREREGSADGWIDARWPAKPVVDDIIVTIDIACAAVAAAWRVLRNMELDDDARRTELVTTAVRDLECLRDRLLDRAGAPPGTTGARVAALTTVVLGRSPSLEGEPREARFLRVIRERRMKQAPALVLRDHAAWHAQALHSFMTVVELLFLRSIALDEKDRRKCGTAEISADGLFRRAREVLARYTVLEASWAATEGDTAEALVLLRRARSLASRSSAIAWCYNEARFRAGAFDAELLADLTKEATGSAELGPAAELLRVAERLGRRRVARFARRAVLERATATPHAWAARVRILFKRPQELADLGRVQALLDETPPADLDASARAVDALYGPDPAVAIAEMRDALVGQRDALEWAALVSEVGPEPVDRLDAPLVRAPIEPGPGALQRALDALRTRLGQRRARSFAHRAALEEHLGRALALAATGEEPAASTWIVALGKPVEGLIAVVDAILDGELGAAAFAAALARANEGLTDALRAAWLSGFHARLSATWPLAAQAPDGDSLRQRAAALARAAGIATSEEERATADRALTDLLADATAPRVEVPDDDTVPAAGADADDEHDDGFSPMQIGEGAIDRSRRDLATPDWALQEGLRQVAFYNLARGGRDAKMLEGTRDVRGALWELRHRDGRHPVRVFYRLSTAGPVVCAVLAKQDDAHQRRAIERVRAWPMPAFT